MSFLIASLAMAACAKPEDPARVELRARLKQAATLSEEEIGRALNEVDRTLTGKAVRYTQDGVTQELDSQRREVVLGMLTNHVGVYDEGLHAIGGATVRVFNAPGLSQHPEYSAARKLFVAVDTFLPTRFEFVYEFPGMGDYAFDLSVEQ